MTKYKKTCWIYIFFGFLILGCIITTFLILFFCTNKTPALLFVFLELILIFPFIYYLFESNVVYMEEKIKNRRLK